MKDSNAIKGFYESPKWRIVDWYWDRNIHGIEADFLPHQGGMIVYYNDTSEWARNCIVKTCNLMRKPYKRWPDLMNDNTVVKSWIGRIFNRTINHTSAWIDKIFKTSIATNLPFRFQGRMVRDSYTAIYPALLLHDRRWMIIDMKPAWYVYFWSLTFYCWRKYLITKKPIYLKLYNTFKSSSKHEWRQRLEWLRETAIELL